MQTKKPAVEPRVDRGVKPGSEARQSRQPNIGVSDLMTKVQFLLWLKQRFCSHKFAIEDLAFVNRESIGSNRVAWPCAKCGKVFIAHCGLDISPNYGYTFRRGGK